jgi:DNA-binding transcriptional MerR regulator/effector-binding domain-containing protein
MLKTGEFARISQVSIKTLRHYDALGLLRPAEIDPESGYRFYAMDQIEDVVRILALKDCGFALEEIGQLLRRHDTSAIETMLRQRLSLQEQFVSDEQARLQRMAARLQQLCASDDTAVYDVALKRTEPVTLIGRRQYVASTDEIGPCAVAAVARLLQAGVAFSGPLIHLYFDHDEMRGDQLDLFVGAPVLAIPAMCGDLECQRLPGGELVACVIYRGDYPGIGAAYCALDRWIAASGSRESGPCREIYLRNPADSDDPSTYLTEIQYPIAALAHDDAPDAGRTTDEQYE